MATEDPEKEQQWRLNVEKALYAQRGLLDQALASLATGVPGKIDMYLLGIAGDGSQEVFRREVEFVKTQFDHDFGTQERSLLLINSRNTMDSAPMATITSLEEDLRTVAERMNKGEDILFLYLTSHGSRDHEFSLEQNGMDVRRLPAALLGRRFVEGKRHPLESNRHFRPLIRRFHRPYQKRPNPGHHSRPAR